MAIIDYLSPKWIIQTHVLWVCRLASSIVHTRLQLKLLNIFDSDQTLTEEAGSSGLNQGVLTLLQHRGQDNYGPADVQHHENWPGSANQIQKSPILTRSRIKLYIRKRSETDKEF